MFQFISLQRHSKSQVKNTEKNIYIVQKWSPLSLIIWVYKMFAHSFFFFFLNGYIIKMMYVGSISSLKYFIFLREPLKSVKIQRQVRDLGLNTNPDKGHMLLRKSVHLSGCHILFLYLPFHPGQVFEQLLMMRPERKLDRLVGRKEAPSTTDHQAECGHCALDPLCFP